MSKHAEAIFAAVKSRHYSPLATSWRRSIELYGLDPDRTAPPDLDLAALNGSLERNHLLVAASQPYIEKLNVTLEDEEGGVFLSDEKGLVIAMRSGRSSDAWGRDMIRILGTSFSEAAVGTAAPGTCLAEDRPLIVGVGEHFLTCHAPFAAVGAPISGPCAALVGALTCVLSKGCAARGKLALLAVTGFARRISLELFARAHEGKRLMLATYDGRHPGAALAVDDDDYVHGATRSARRLLGLDEARFARPFSLRDLASAETSREPLGDLAAVDARVIADTLGRCNGNRAAAAKALGLSRSTLYRKLPR